ncbi:MAG: hypothetical protein ACRENG_18650, partial [bacterium]
MGSRPQMPHDRIVAYLRGESDRETRARIHRLRKDDAVYELLFDLIDTLKPQVDVRKHAARKPPPTTFAKVEELLTRIFSEDPGSEEAQEFIGGLLASPSFYQRLLIKLAAATPKIALDDVPEIAQIRIQTDEEILKKVVSGAVVEAQPEHKRIGVPSLSAFVESMREAVWPLTRIPRLVVVAPLVVIVALMVYK